MCSNVAIYITNQSDLKPSNIQCIPYSILVGPRFKSEVEILCHTRLKGLGAVLVY